MPLSDVERRVCERVAQCADRMLEDLAAHVAIPTGRGYRPGLDRYRAIVAQRLAALGAHVEELPGAAAPPWLAAPGSRAEAAAPPPVLMARGPEGGGPRVLIAAHLDTVHDPDGPFRSLEIQPDGVTVRGPGAVDMKGGIVIALAALEALRACGVAVSWTFLANSDEETGSFASMRIIQDVAAQHQVGVAVEPALPGGALAIERMGSGQFKIETFGRAAHVGREFTRGVSAVNELARVLLDVAALADPGRGAIVNVGPLQGGDVVNAVPDHAAAWGNLRYGDAATGERLAASLGALARGGAGDVPRVVMHHLVNRPLKPATPAVRALADAAVAAAADLGQGLPFASTGGVCDGNLMQAAGLPTLDTLGVRGGNLHREDEFVEIRSLVERGQLLAVLLARVARSLD